MFLHVLHLFNDYGHCVEGILYFFDIVQDIFDMVSKNFCGCFELVQQLPVVCQKYFVCGRHWFCDLQ